MKRSLRHSLSSLKVKQKIGLGYVLILGIAVSGTAAGFKVGNYYEQQATSIEKHAEVEIVLLQRLQTQVLQARTHQQQLIPLAATPEDFWDEYDHILKHTRGILDSWSTIEAFIRTSVWQDAQHREELVRFLRAYDQVPDRYARNLDARVRQVRGLDLTVPADIEQAQAILLEFTNSNLALDFDGISDDLGGLINTASEELALAEELHQRAAVVAPRIALVSIVVSVAIAILLAALTSEAIAQPLQALTETARRSTEESDFTLRVPIERDDEIGALARSFNQLIAAVQSLLQEQQDSNTQLDRYSQELNAKMEELKRTQMQMVQNEKMSALGQMVAGLAHEINNPINFIHGNLTHVQQYIDDLLNFLSLYQEYYPKPAAAIQAEAEDLDIEYVQADLPKTLSSMRTGTERIRQIVLSLRNFSRMDEAELKDVDIHEGIESTLLILQHRLKAKPDRSAIQINRDYSELPLVDCYPAQLNQAFMNILANAIDALEDVDSQQAARGAERRPLQIAIRTSQLDANWVQIEIADNGAGMSESVRNRIFDPFFTTKSIGKGTGMGMPISYQIVVEKHGGKLECLSEIGQGTRFSIQIPIQHGGKVPDCEATTGALPALKDSRSEMGVRP